MNKSVILIGAGGHARSVIALLQNNGFAIKSIYDNSWKQNSLETILSIPVCGTITDVPSLENICLAVGDNLAREKLYHQFSKYIFKEVIEHPNAFIENSAVLGQSNLVFANAFVNADVKIGDNNILNTGCIIEHECVIGNHSHISVSAVLCGRVVVGNNCFIGAGSVIKDKIKIADHVTIGAGTVVVKDITEPGVYVGNPSRKIK
jgi:sugar O-acyltransferase (sialic acid O-acetyltransferase NeuD family)